MENTNQLHQETMYYPNGDRVFPEFKKALVTTKKGMTKKMSSAEVKKLIENKTILGEIDVAVEFKTDKEGIKLAKQFQRLAENPSVKLNVTFKKITDAKN